MIENLTLFLILGPALLALVVYGAPRRLYGPLVVLSSALLFSAALLAWLLHAQSVAIALPAWTHAAIVLLDFALIGYFLWVGVRQNHRLIVLLALLQGALLGWVLYALSAAPLAEIVVDKLGATLWLLVTGVGGLIAWYAVGYMRHESDSPRRQQAFVAILIAFLGVMNALFVADSIELFFLLFELTTLSSFILIGWRRDAASRLSSLQALWMNQLGGVLLLLGMGVIIWQGAPLFFSALLESQSGWALGAAAFLIAGALIKGAQMPFDRWLLGAMVAPTPVSAILHSSTMVKIAPFMVLKLGVLLHGTPLAVAVAYFGGFVFVAGAFVALARNHLKEILAYSTISLLGLMVMLSAVATPLALSAALTLILFHGVAKAMLFMEAGVLEKLHHAKSVDEMGGMLSRAPMSVFLVLLGFASITLPPFGALVGKWVAIEASAQSAFLFLFVALGSVVIALLYFKVAGYMLGKPGSQMGLTIERIPRVFSVTTLLLGVTLALSAILIAPTLVYLIVPAIEPFAPGSEIAHKGLTLMLPSGDLPFWQIVGAWLLLLLLPLAGLKRMRRVDRVREYSGGERIEMQPVTFYFPTPRWIVRAMAIIGAIFFGLIVLLGGVLWVA